MRVLFDDHIFSIQRHGGISRCFVELIAALRQRGDVETALPFTWTINAHLLERPELGARSFLGDGHFAGKRSLLRAINRPGVRAAIRFGSYDVFHPTFYDAGAVKAARRRPVVVTIHDMAPELVPDAFDRPETIHPHKRALCSAAAAIVAVSETTKADVVRLYGIDPARITVVQHGVSAEAVWTPGRPGADLPPRYLMLVGRRDGYKNFLGAASALAAVLRRVPDLHVLCVGGGGLRPAERSPFEMAGVANRLHQRSLSDDGLAFAYAHADAFVYPSLYEGFGLPILESFVNGCPAVVSRRSCFPEVAGDAALYFDPDAPDTLEDALIRLLGDKDLRDRLSAAGHRRAEAFTWEAAASKLAALYQRLSS